MVRLKEIHAKIIIDKIIFQFLMVRLKEMWSELPLEGQ